MDLDISTIYIYIYIYIDRRMEKDTYSWLDLGMLKEYHKISLQLYNMDIQLLVYSTQAIFKRMF